jgi:Fe-S cluster biogenesis protein NfuA
MDNLEEKIKKVLDEVRPSLQADGGDVEFISWDKDNSIVFVRLKGACGHCPFAQITLKKGIEAYLKKKIKEVKEVQLG